MDSYLKEGGIKNASTFYLNINFEILNGCKLNCIGCHVDKNAQTPILNKEKEQLESLIGQMSNNGYYPFIAFVGPTDFLSADNFADGLSDVNVRALLSKFKRISLQTSYLDMRFAKKAADVLKKYYENFDLEINIILDPSRANDKNYVETIEKNKDYFKNLLARQDLKTFGVMNVFDFNRQKISGKKSLYDHLHEKFSHLFETTIDYNFSFGRNPEINPDQFLNLATSMKLFFEESNSSEKDSQFISPPRSRISDSFVERQYTYRNGKLYFSPLLYERYVSFDSIFEIPIEKFSSSGIESFERELQLIQYSKAHEKEECESCPYLSSCVDRGVLFLMDAYNVKKCVVAKKAVFAVGTMGALPFDGSQN